MSHGTVRHRFAHVLSLVTQPIHAQFADLRALAALVALPRCPQIPLAQSALAGGALRSRDAPTIVRLFLSLCRPSGPANPRGLLSF